MVDIGCGGGIYSFGFAALGARSVIGIDKAQRFIEEATRNVSPADTITFRSARDAEDTQLPAASADIVFERAVIHHLTELQMASNAAEAKRLLRDGGLFASGSSSSAAAGPAAARSCCSGAIARASRAHRPCHRPAAACRNRRRLASRSLVMSSADPSNSGPGGDPVALCSNAWSNWSVSSLSLESALMNRNWLLAAPSPVFSFSATFSAFAFSFSAAAFLRSIAFLISS